MILWCLCILFTIITEAVNSVWTVFLLKKIVETILQDREYAPGPLLVFALSVLAGAVLEILRQKMRYLLYRGKVLRLEDSW